MKKSNFVSFNDYLGANADDARAMEGGLRGDEMAALKAARTDIDKVGKEAIQAAYDGVSTADDMEGYAGVAEAQKSVDTAKQIQGQMQTDAGQEALLAKKYGGGGIDALMAFGANAEGSNETPLSAYLGMDSAGIGNKWNEYGDKYKENRADYVKAKAELDAVNANNAEYDKEEAAYKEAHDKELQAYREAARQYLLSDLAPGDVPPGTLGFGTTYDDPGFVEYLKTGKDTPGKYYAETAMDYYANGSPVQNKMNKLGIGQKPTGKTFESWLSDRGVTPTKRKKQQHTSRLANTSSVGISEPTWNTGGVKW